MYEHIFNLESIFLSYIKSSVHVTSLAYFVGG